MNRKTIVSCTMHTLLASACFAIAAGCMALMPSCTSEGEIAANRAKLVSQRDALNTAAGVGDATIPELQQRAAAAAEANRIAQAALAAAAADDPARPQLVQAVADLSAAARDATAARDALVASTASAKAQVVTITGQIEASDAFLREAELATNKGTQLGGLIATFVPGLAAAAPIVAGSFYRQLKLGQANTALTQKSDQQGQAITSIVRSIDAVAEVAPAVADAFRVHSGLIDSVQGAAGKSAVDQAQGKPSGSALKLAA